MNNKDQFTKYVYKPFKSSFFCESRKSYITEDFGLWMSYAFSIQNATYIEFLHGLYPAKAFKDKHGNIIVRIFHEDIKQLSLDFTDDHV